jgi:threonine dehydrogenase-like Zn-dependent dehydrogenase
MKALCWHGKKDIRCDTVPDPQIEYPRDAIVKVTSCAICGSDLHLFDAFIPGMMHGDILGHEFMGEVVEVGRDLRGKDKLKVGDRVVVPFTICCGECEQCRLTNFALCERSNRNKHLADKVFGHGTAGLFGYSHLTGGYAGGQAEYVRVPFADVAPVKVPAGLTDEQALFLGDIYPTGWQAAAQCEIQPDDTVAIWGAGPVGQFAIRAAVLLGARQVIAIDCVPERLDMAEAGGAIPLDFEEESVIERLDELTDGRGPEKCIDAVDLETHVLREMIHACRPGGVLSIPGVHGGVADEIPFGALAQKGLTVRSGQTHVNRWTGELLRRVEEGQIDPSFVVTHSARLEDGPAMYRAFREKEDGCVKVVLKP